MTKVSLAILKVLSDNEIKTSSKALSVSQIILLIDEKTKSRIARFIGTYVI